MGFIKEIGKLLGILSSPFQSYFSSLGAAYQLCKKVVGVSKSALKEVHGAEKIDAELSSYYVVEEVQSTFRGMEVAIESEAWVCFSEVK